MCGGGGGSSQPSQQTVTQVTIPPELMPYAKRALGTAEQLAYEKPYEAYTGQRFAGLNPLQQQAFQGLQQQQVAPQIGEASGLASLVGQRAGQVGAYTPMQAQQFYEGPQLGSVGIDFQQVSAPQATDFQMGGPERVSGAGYGPIGMGPAERVGISPLTTYQMGGPERVGAERFGLGAMQEYMSPYMQGVVEQQKQGAVQDYLRSVPGLRSGAARAGALGGSREAILESEARRGLSQRLGDIQASGLQSAYQQAAQQFGADRAAAMQAALANQQAGLTTGQQNLAAALGVQQLGTQAGLQAALANQQAGLTVGQQNLAAEQARQQFMGQTGLQAALANQQAGMQVGQQNLQARINQSQFAAQQAMQAGQLNQAAGLQAQAQRLQQQQALNQAALQNAAQRAQFGLSGAQLAESSRQFGAGLGMQGLQQQLAAAGMLGQMGQQQFGQQQAALQAQMAGGAQLQAMEQQRLQAAYEDFMARQRYPYTQLGFVSDLIRGTPTAGGIQTMYQAPPSMLSQVAGAGLGLAGLYGATRP